jgi:hypothetical protein
MHNNNDRYSFEQFKIAYEKNRLTIASGFAPPKVDDEMNTSLLY